MSEPASTAITGQLWTTDLSTYLLRFYYNTAEGAEAAVRNMFFVLVSDIWACLSDIMLHIY